MSKQLMSTACLCLSFWAATVAHGQRQAAAASNRSKNINPLTPRQKSVLNRMASSDSAAAANLDKGKYAAAEASARQSLALGIGSGKGQELLAEALNAEGKSKEALQVYRQIAAQGGQFPRNMLPYALLLLKAGQWPQAVSAYNTVLPFLSDGDLVQANLHFSLNKLDSLGLETAIHIGLGLTYVSSDSWGGHSRKDRAMLEFDQALRLQPASALANYYYGYGWKQLDPKDTRKHQQAAKAKAALQKAASSGNSSVKKAVNRLNSPN
ncbi:MAG: hypothetical protein ABIY70_16185 [Capsulimonas sp.]|uniref:hypothetical protein n=1 Tax=Capsulimonas sp. TaxID=2494211 RepID=UPI003263085E